jgi:hypothetical protein
MGLPFLCDPDEGVLIGKHSKLKASDQMAARESQKARDHVGLLQLCFQDLLHAMVDTIGRIQRDAAVDPSEVEPERILFRYDEIPNDAKDIVRRVLQIDALLDEAADSTLLGKTEDEIFEQLKTESDAYEQSAATLSERTEEASRWIARAGRMLDLIASRTLEIQSGDDNSEEDCSE